ncbi:hypothetical protein GJ496_010433 [Pomphorhynchus laevis]|nr:hypothetical protein GJ496_010433 [Pomphorhynchus laevis]
MSMWILLITSTTSMDFPTIGHTLRVPILTFTFRISYQELFHTVIRRSCYNEVGEWILEPGAFVLSNNGVCCIDEFTSIKDCDQASVHEAMEQQTVSIAKAGIVCKLRTECSLLACCNPDDNGCVKMADSLISRFDLIIPMRDIANNERDILLCDQILGNHTKQTSSNDLLTCDELKDYFKAVKMLNVTVNYDANKLIQMYYSYRRNSPFRDACRTTVRLLESIIRLTESHAKLLGRDVADRFDALNAIMLLELGIRDSVFSPSLDPLAIAPNNWAEFYAQIEQEARKALVEQLKEARAKNPTERYFIRNNRVVRIGGIRKVGSVVSQSNRGVDPTRNCNV